MLLFSINRASANAVQAFLEKYANDSSVPLTARVSIPEYVQKIKKYGTVFEAWENDRLLALVIAYVNDRTSRRAFVTYVRTVPEACGRGIATKLFDELFRFCDAQEFSVIALEVARTNRTAIAFYQKLKFLFERENETSFFMKKEIGKFPVGNA